MSAFAVPVRAAPLAGDSHSLSSQLTSALPLGSLDADAESSTVQEDAGSGAAAAALLPASEADAASGAERERVAPVEADADGASAAYAAFYPDVASTPLSFAAAVDGPSSGLPAYPTQPAGHVSLPARALPGAAASASPTAPAPSFAFSEPTQAALQSRPTRSLFMSETLRERLLLHAQLTVDRLQPDGQRHPPLGPRGRSRALSVSSQR